MSDSHEDDPDFRLGVPIEAVPEGEIVQGRFEGETVVLARTGGQFFALQATCSHMGAPLCDGAVVEGRIHCPWHHARFSLATGEAVAAPAFSALKRYHTRIDGDRVYVLAQLPNQPPPQSRAADTSRIVIVGAGAAGYACAEMLARQGAGERVTLIGNDVDGSYDRTMCSKQYMIGMASRREAILPPLPDEVTRLQQTIDRVSLEEKSLVSSDGEVTAFDVLILATGAQPLRPSLPGFDHPKVFTLRALHDTDAIVEAAAGARRVAVIGASYIALESAASLRQRKLDVTVIAPERIPLEKIVGSEVGALIKRVHEERGVRFVLERKVQSYDGDRVLLDHGDSVEADLVVLGMGVAPDIRLAQDAGIACAGAEEGGGVLVNEFLQTAIPGVFAIGDIASYPHSRSGKRIRVEHWVHAQRQGQYLARCLLGEQGRYSDEPFFWSAHFDTGLLYVGHVDRIERTELDGSIAERSFTLRLTGDAQETAFISCNRDLPSLVVEANWEHRLPAR